MKKLFTLLLLTLLPVFAMAEGDDPVLIDGFCYKLIQKSNEAELLPNPDKNYSGDLVIPSSVTYEGTDYTVTTIGENALFNCSDLTSLTLPSSLTTIKGNNFDSYYHVQIPVYIPDLVKWCSIKLSSNGISLIADKIYVNGEEITDLVIPEGITSISATAFSGWKSIKTAHLPNSLVEIGGGAFSGCKNLTSINIPENIKIINSSTFSQSGLTTIDLPNGLTDIDSYAFYGCTSLTSITLPNSIYYLGVDVFSNCTSLTSITLSSKLGEVPSRCFEGCTSLTEVKLPEGIRKISSRALAKCTELRDVYCYSTEVVSMTDNSFYDSYPEGITVHVPESSIEAYKADEYWSKFKEIVDLNSSGSGSGTGQSVESVKIGELYYKLIGKSSMAELLPNPDKNYSGDLVIPSSVTYEGTYYTVTTIGENALFNCSDLTSLTLPSSLTTIKGNNFDSYYHVQIPVYIPDLVKWCSIKLSSNGISFIADKIYVNGEEITDLVIPEGITSISATAFSGWKSIKTAHLPNSLVEIGGGAFSGCKNLTSINIPENIKIINSSTFSQSGLTTIDLPNGLTDIDSYAFYGCTSLTSITLPNSIYYLGVDVFSNCTSLTSITLSSKLGEVPSRCFEGCTSLTEVKLPEGIRKISSRALAKCTELRDVYCYSTEVVSMTDNSFYDSYPEGITVHVPEISIDAYKANEYWSKFKEIVGFTSESAQVVEIVTPEGEVIKTEVTITIVDEDSKTAIITAASIPSSETGSTEIAIPVNVGGYTITGIEANAFAGMTGVTDIYFPDTDQPISLGTNALKIDDEHVATVHVPVGLLGSYALNEQLSQNFADGKVKATVTAPSRYWTFSAGVDVVVPEGVGVYICKFENEDQVRITELGDDQLLVGSKRIIKANNGVLIACIDGTGGNAYDIVANPGGQWSMAPASYDAKSYGYDNMLEPVLVSKNYPATDYYVLKNGEFHKILANSSKMPAGKAVLRIPGTGVAGARILSIVGGSNDGTTGIHNHHVIEAESKWFDLQGRRIERPTKVGLYINNGKKVLVK